MIASSCQENKILRTLRDLAELAKLTSFVREKTLSIFISGWKPLMGFLIKLKIYFCDLWLSCKEKMNYRKKNNMM